MRDLSQLCIHTITTKPWDFSTTVRKFSSAGVKGITVWRQAIEGLSRLEVKKQIHDNGLTPVALCRGGFFPAADAAGRAKAIEDNQRAIEEAAEIGAPQVVLVCGAVPGQPLSESRKQISDGIAACLDFAARHRVELAIEPLHPMYAADRSAINTLKSANDLCQQLNSPWVGVALDVYHVWWDPDLQSEIQRCGENGWLRAFHICDWKTTTLDMLNDRGLMGEGCIPIRRIRRWVEQAGFQGFREVEIFSNHYWAQDQDSFLKQIIESYQQYV